MYLELFFTFFASEVAGGLAVGGGLLVLVLVLVPVLVLGGGGVLRDEMANLDLRVEWLVVVDLDLRVKLLATAASQLAASRSLCLFSFSFSFSFFFEFSSFLSLRNSKLVMCTSPKITNRIKSN